MFVTGDPLARRSSEQRSGRAAGLPGGPPPVRWRLAAARHTRNKVMREHWTRKPIESDSGAGRDPDRGPRQSVERRRTNHPPDRNDRQYATVVGQFELAASERWVLLHGWGLIPFSVFTVSLLTGLAPCPVLVAHLRVTPVFAFLRVIPVGRSGGWVSGRARATNQVQQTAKHGRSS